jgi:hypothetical protein
VLKLQDKKYIYVETIYPEGMSAPATAPPTTSTETTTAPAASPAKPETAASPAKAASPAVETKKPAASPQ